MHQTPRPAAPGLRRHTLDTTGAVPAARIMAALNAPPIPAAAELPPTYRPPVGDGSERRWLVTVGAITLLIGLGVSVLALVYVEEIVRAVWR